MLDQWFSFIQLYHPEFKASLQVIGTIIPNRNGNLCHRHGAKYEHYPMTGVETSHEIHYCCVCKHIMAFPAVKKYFFARKDNAEQC